ncbi:MAG TPA: cellulase family glycosylhydrolase [Candidatus Limiplasma pullistercoris]|nr:cellulase family glycosylhydrolase [Candidatus Limiplasma pullistercoris]
MKRLLCMLLALVMTFGLVGYGAAGAEGSSAETEKSEWVTASTYRAMLVEMLEELAPEQMDYFDSKVKDVNLAITRGDAVRMAYYAAVCIGADDYNGYSFSSDLADSDGRMGEAGNFLELICPDVYKNIPVTMANHTWGNEFTAAGLWNVWHVDTVSGKQVFEFDEELQSMRMYDMLTMEEAETSIERLRTGYGVKRYVSVDSAEATSPALSDEALAKTAERCSETLDALPRLTGFVLANDGYYSIHTIVKTVDDIRRIADWGFNTVRLRITYETLFNQDGSQIDLTQAERLDELVEACIEADIHLNLLLCTLPGRTKWVDLNDVSSGGETDLFINPERQKEAVSVWATLAARYQDVSGAHLSFTPFWEPDGDLGINSEEGWEHTPQDTCDTLALLIEAVRAQDPERFIFYEPTAHIAAEATIQESSLFYEPLKSRFDNLMISYNFCQNAYVFAEITDIVGEDVDLSNYSMFKPEYPVTNYGVNDTIPDGGELTIDGFLPVGTVIDLYLAYADGQSALTITGDGTELYHEELSSGDYRPGRPLSSFYPYATSDKKISVTLAETTDEVAISARGADIKWCGMDVILPEEYAVERWYMNSGRDNFFEDEARFLWLATSTVMISPSERCETWHITIRDDVTFTTGEVFAEANAETIEHWCAEISDFSPQCIVRYEDACFSLGTTQGSILRYYEDVLSTFEKYGFSWLSNDYELILQESTNRIADAEVVEYDGYDFVNLELLELLQKYQEK